MSKRHPRSRRLAQADQSEPDDVFIAKTLEISNWARNNQQLLTVLAVVVVLAVAGGLYYRNYRQALVQQAAEQLEAVHQSLALQDREGAKDQLVTFLQRFGGTPYEGEARMLLGEVYLETGAAEQALAVLEPLARSPRDPLELQAAALLAAAYEQEERWSDAEETYLRIADRSQLEFQIRDALASAARIRTAQGDTTGAIALYERLLDEMGEDDPDRGVYEMRLAELRTAAGT